MSVGQFCARCNGAGVVRPAADDCPRCSGTGVEPVPAATGSGEPKVRCGECGGIDRHEGWCIPPVPVTLDRETLAKVTAALDDIEVAAQTWCVRRENAFHTCNCGCAGIRAIANEALALLRAAGQRKEDN